MITKLCVRGPSFEALDRKYWVDENFPIGEPLQQHGGAALRLRSNDADADECFSKVGFTFQAQISDTDYEDYFYLFPNTGDIQLQQNLSTLTLETDSNGIRNLITLPVQAEDEYQCASQRDRD